MGRWPWILAVAVAVGGESGAAAMPALEAVAGFNGFHRPGKWAGVRVVVENFPRADRQQTLKSYDGRLEIVSEGGGSAAPPVLHTLDLRLAPNDRKVAWIHCRFPATQLKARVRYTVRGEEIAATDIDLKPLDPAESLVLVAKTTEDTIGLPSLAQTATVHVATIDPDLFPTAWPGYEPADLVVVPRLNERLLADGRDAALRTHVEMGGTLLALTGRWTSSWQGSSLGQLLPQGLSAPVSMAIRDGELSPLEGRDAEGGLMVSPIQTNAGDADTTSAPSIVAAIGKTPLLATQPLGNGTVMTWSGDWNPALFEVAPLPRWLSGWLATRTSDEVLRRQINDRFLYADYSALLGGGPAASLPSPALIFYVLLAYFLLIGPVNFFVLWRLKRLEWAWVTIPLVVTVFGVGLLLAGHALRGGQVIWRSFEFVTATSGQESARSEVHAMNFSARPGEASLTAPAAGEAQSPHTAFSAATDAQFRRRRMAAPAFSPAPVDSGEFRLASTDSGTHLQRLPLRQWDSTFLKSERPVKLGGEIEASLQVDGNRLEVNVVNNGGRALLRPWAVVGIRAWPIADRIEPGEKVTVLKTFSEPQRLMPRPQRAPETDTDIPEAARAIFHDCLAEPNYPGQGAFIPAAMIVSELSRPVHSIAPPEQPTESTELAFLALAAPLRFSGDPASQQWFGPRTLSESVGSTAGSGLGVETVFVRPNENVLFGFRGFRVAESSEALETVVHLRLLDASRGRQTQGLPLPDVDAFDWSTGRWRALPMEETPREVKIAPRLAEFRTFVPAAGSTDALATVRSRHHNPITGGALLRIRSQRPIQAIGPLQRLADPREIPPDQVEMRTTTPPDETPDDAF